MNASTQPITLVGAYATLEPLSHAHHDGLVSATLDGELWKLWYTSVASPEGMRDEIDRRLGLQQAGMMLPWTVLDNASGKVVGMTTYMNIDATYRRIEIGSTWYAKSAQRTPINTECKLMLLTHAFESLVCIAVEFRTSFFNHTAAAPSNALEPNRMVSCAAISFTLMAVFETRSFIRSSPQNGQRLNGISGSGLRGDRRHRGPA